MTQLIRDLRFAVRRLLREPGFTATVLLVLTLGLGGGTLLFSVVRTVLLRPLPYPEPERLALVWESYPPGGYDQLLLSGRDYRDLADGNRSFEELAAFRFVELTLTGEGAPESLEGLAVTPNLPSMVGARPSLGRSFPTAREDQDEALVILGQRLWRDRFGSDPGVLGRRILLSGQPYTVIGVTDRGFRFPPPFTLGGRTYGSGEGVDLLIPMPRAWLDADRGRRQLMALGRLQPGVSPEQADRELENRAAAISAAHPDTNPEGLSAYAAPLHEQAIRQVRPTLLLALASVGLIVLIACANVANLLLARAVGERQQWAVRAALGADRRRLGRQLLTESLLLGLIGGALGIGFAWGMIRLLASQSLEQLPRLAELRLDLPTWLFAVALAVTTSVLFGLVPAWRSAQPDLVRDLQAARGDSLGRGGLRALHRFVILQLALSLTLLGAAGLTARSFWSLLHTDLGFEAGDTLVVSISLPEQRYPRTADRRRIREELLRQIGALPGVEAVGAATSLPLSALMDGVRYRPEGQPPASPGEEPVALLQEVTPGYFAAMGLRLIRGRWLESADQTSKVSRVLVNRTLARRAWPGENPVGRRLQLGGDADEGEEGRSDRGTWPMVVGMVEDVRLRGVDAPADAALYRPLRDNAASRLLMVVRPAPGAGDPTSALRSVVWTVDPDLPVETTTLKARLDHALSQPRLGALLLTLLAAVAVALAAAGTWGVIAYTTLQRQHELGIRMAFGASRNQVLRMILRSGLRLAIPGTVLGLLGAFAAGRVLAGQLPGMPAYDVAVFFLATALLLVVALVAVYIPARRLVPRDPAALLDAQ